MVTNLNVQTLLFEKCNYLAYLAGCDHFVCFALLFGLSVTVSCLEVFS